MAKAAKTSGGLGAQPPAVVGASRFHQPTARECALLIIRLLQAREDEVGEVSRARISQATIRRLCGRSQISTDLLVDIQEFLLAGGWCLFCTGPSYFAVIKVKAVEGWARISSKRIGDELIKVARGTYDFQELEGVLLAQGSNADDTDD